MASEGYKVGNKSIGGEIRLFALTPLTTVTPVKTITVVKGNATSIENPIGNDARVYVGSDQFKSLKDDLGLAGKKVVVTYTSTPVPTPDPNAHPPIVATYERITDFSHYTVSA